ncbi:MAG TPA: glycosyltransferase [Thermoanaerobaculia bacterium]|jgi:glycosyltransferase involved in cell wall biosynthesis|nr:glycosyltransferase [Thermoanaerobaculia bacterium]
MNLRVALVTHCYLEPTHYAIGQTLDAIEDVDYSVFARRFGRLADNVGERNIVDRDLLSRSVYAVGSLSGFSALHIIYDGDTAFDAIQMAQDARLPVVLSFHGGFDTNAKIYDSRYRERTIEACYSSAIITVVGETDRQRLADLGVTKGVEILPVPIDPTLLPIRQTYDRHRLILVGRLVPKKGIDLALACLAMLPDDFTLTIVGDGDDESWHTLKEIARGLGVERRVTWTGFLPLPQMLKELAVSGLLLHPARVCADGNAEGTPQAILWAQALGVPVVATSTGSISDIVHDQQTGLLVPPHAEALATAIACLSANSLLRSRVTENGHQVVMQRHRLAAVACRLNEFYSRAIRIGAAPRIHRSQSATDRIAIRTAAEYLQISAANFRFVAKGGHGHIYAAQLADRTLVAVKFPAYADHPSERWPILEQKLLREATVFSEAAGEGLPKLVAFDEEGRFLVREFVVGEPLARAVRYVGSEGRIALMARVLRLGQALFARFHAGAKGVFLLRDFKPQNIVVPTEGSVGLQLIDVGAVCPEREIATRTWNHDRLGTGQWLHWAPEQLLGLAQEINRRVDYFALGVTAFYTLTGKWPYSNRCSVHDQVLARYRAEHEVAVARLETASDRGEISPEVSTAIAGHLEPDVHYRSTSTHASSQLAIADDISTDRLFGLRPN